MDRHIRNHLISEKSDKEYDRCLSLSGEITFKGVKLPAAILQCKDCKPHEYQDKTYGKGMRVMNECKKPDTYRCTVCSKERSK